MCHFACYSFVVSKIIVNNIFPAVWRGGISPRARNKLGPKGLKVCSYVEKCAEFKNQTLKKPAGTQKCYAQRMPLGYAISQNSAKMGVPLQVYTLNHVISVVKCKFWQQTIYNDQCSI